MVEVDVTYVLLDDVRQFIDEKWKHPECERCGTQVWGVYPDPIVYAYLPISGERSPPMSLPPPSRSVLPLRCDNCGNVRLIDAEVFEQWRAEQKAKATKSSD